MAQHMGLLGETHVFDLLDRTKYASPACAYDYYVVNRNYDPITYMPSIYVNGRQYGYSIWDGCFIGVNVGDAFEVPKDAAVPRFTAGGGPGRGFSLGAFI